MNTAIQFAKSDTGASPVAAAFLEDLIDACVMESVERMKYEGRMMKWGSWFGAFSSFNIHPSTLRPATEASAAQQRDFLTHLHQTLNAPSHPDNGGKAIKIPDKKYRFSLPRDWRGRMGHEQQAMVGPLEGFRRETGDLSPHLTSFHFVQASCSLLRGCFDCGAKGLLLSRVVDRKFVIGDAEREQFRMFMRMQENFSGSRVLSYCVMSNHFHILLEVPPMAEGGISDEELMKRLAAVYSDVIVCRSVTPEGAGAPVDDASEGIFGGEGVGGALGIVVELGGEQTGF